MWGAKVHPESSSSRDFCLSFSLVSSFFAISSSTWREQGEEEETERKAETNKKEKKRMFRARTSRERQGRLSLSLRMEEV